MSPAILDLIWMYKWPILWFLVGYIVFRPKTPIGTPMRFNPKTGAAPGESWFIQSSPVDGVLPHSCSFVEFDGHGDYIEFEQHQDAWRKVRELAEANPLLLVTYCHGWKNNSQSSDVVRFVDFLGRLAASPAVTQHHYRVHGIYLGWRGNLYWPHLEKDGENDAYVRTAERFGGPVVSDRWSRRFTWTAWLQENLSYWSRRSAAEHKVSSVAMARTVYTCASLVRAIDKDNRDKFGDLAASRVMVMGHSFGALMLERALNATCLDPLMNQWSWFVRSQNQPAQPVASANPLPLDFVFFVNSAAPSIYAKVMRDFLTAHQSALLKGESAGAYAPIFVSLTSSADWATRYAHPAANLLCRFYPSLRHKYTQLIKIEGKCAVNQSWFFRRTPGHQPLLVDHWLTRCGPAARGLDPRQVLEDNLDYETDQPLRFLAHLSGPGGALNRWELTLTPARADEKWNGKLGPLAPSRCSYWIIRCDKQIIRDHNDVWSDTAMEVYAALYRLVIWARANPRSNQVLHDYWAGKSVDSGLADE
jgi:hypothetical protein